MAGRIAIVDYRMGNLRSVFNAFERVGVGARIVDRAEDILAADKIVLPGVGAFGDAMKTIRELGLLDALNEQALARKAPILGICLGVQLLGRHSEEGGGRGLGWIAADVKRLHPQDPACRVPHIGWNELRIRPGSRLLADIPGDAAAYFVHSYHVVADDEAIVVATTDHGGPVTAVVETGHLFGAQFHPEKSHHVGLKMLKNFAEL